MERQRDQSVKKLFMVAPGNGEKEEMDIPHLPLDAYTHTVQLLADAGLQYRVK